MTTTTTAGTPPGTGTPPTTGTASAGLGSYMPLFPFSDATAVAAWQASYRSGGHQPWHLDAGQTAVAFAAYLGYTEVNKVVGVTSNSTGAHVAVGFGAGDSAPRNVTSAVVHLVRWGTGPYIPWEVVGTDDTTFSLTAPAYGSGVHTPFTVGGAITGVDENINVRALNLASSAPVGTYCCIPAGGSNSPWKATLAVTAQPNGVLTVAASTGGHVAGVERFTVTGVILRPAGAPTSS